MEKEEIKPLENMGKEENISIIDRADAIAKRIEEGNKRAEELLARQEQLAAKMMLAGRADAGQMPQVAAPMSDVEYSKRFFNTGVL